MSLLEIEADHLLNPRPAPQTSTVVRSGKDVAGTVPSATQESSRPVPQQVAASRLLVDCACGCVLCSIPLLVMPRASRNQLATVCVKLTEPQ